MGEKSQALVELERRHEQLSAVLAQREIELGDGRTRQKEIVDALCDARGDGDRQKLAAEYGTLRSRCVLLEAEVGALKARARAAYCAIFEQGVIEAQGAFDEFDGQTYRPAKETFMAAEGAARAARNNHRTLSDELGREGARERIVALEVEFAKVKAKLRLAAGTRADLQLALNHARDGLTIAERDGDPQIAE